MHSSNEDNLWFCAHCLQKPILRFLTLTIRRQDRLISSLEDRIRALESSTHAVQLSSISQNNEQSRKIVISEPKPDDINISTIETGNSELHAVNPPVSTTKQPASKIRSEDLTVICTNVAEPTATSIKGRNDEDLLKWKHICQVMVVTIQPASLTRLSRHRSSQHVGESCLPRVTLRNMEDLEAILLSSHLLRKEASPVRIFPDMP